MNGTEPARSAELLRVLVQNARFVEDEAWRGASELRDSGAAGQELIDALRLVEKATAHRVRLEQELHMFGSAHADSDPAAYTPLDRDTPL